MTRRGIQALPVGPLPRVVERARAAERDGLDTLWFSDDPLAACDIYPTLAACARATSRIRLGAVTDVDRRHPTVTACGFASLDEMFPGRFVLGLESSGDNLDDFLLRASLIQGLLRGETLEWNGRPVRTRFVTAPTAVPIYTSALVSHDLDLLVRGSRAELDAALHERGDRSVVWFADSAEDDDSVDEVVTPA